MYKHGRTKELYPRHSYIPSPPASNEVTNVTASRPLNPTQVPCTDTVVQNLNCQNQAKINTLDQNEGTASRLLPVESTTTDTGRSGVQVQDTEPIEEIFCTEIPPAPATPAQAPKHKEPTQSNSSTRGRSKRRQQRDPLHCYLLDDTFTRKVMVTSPTTPIDPEIHYSLQFDGGARENP